MKPQTSKTYSRCWEQVHYFLTTKKGPATYEGERARSNRFHISCRGNPLDCLRQTICCCSLRMDPSMCNTLLFVRRMSVSLHK